ncbi:MAG: SEL1-like repeat protein [Alphaproteobacteria bacterium]
MAQETGRFDPQTLFPAYNRTSVAAIQGAADGGDAGAARLLGDMYYWGDKVEPDRAQAEKYWTLGAKGGDELANQRLKALRNGQPIPVYYTGSLARDITMGFWDRSVNPLF